jgi:hypothetical protein
LAWKQHVALLAGSTSDVVTPLESWLGRCLVASAGPSGIRYILDLFDKDLAS